MKKIIWNNEIINTIKIIYPDNGLEFTLSKINKFETILTRQQLIEICKKNKIKVSSERKNQVQKSNSSKYLYPNKNIFIEINRNETAYIMGFFWADGYLSKYSITLSILKTDFLDIQKYFSMLGEWNINYRKTNRKNRKEQTNVICSNSEIVNIFDTYGYKNKSLIPPKFINNNINDEICKTFILGWFDGDGCIYEPQNQIYFCGSYEQNWAFLEDILLKLNIKYSIYQKKQKSGKYSVIYMGGKKNILKFLNWLYSTEIKGLNRKYQKYINIKQSTDNITSN